MKFYIIILIATSSILASAQSTLTDTQLMQCNRDLKRVLFLHSNGLIGEKAFAKRYKSIQERCGNGFISAIDIPHTGTSNFDTLIVTHNPNFQLARIKAMGEQSAGFIVSGLVLTTTGTCMIVFTKYKPYHHAMLLIGGMFCAAGGLFEMVGIAQRLVYKNKKNDLELRLLLGANNGAGVGLKW